MLRRTPRGEQRASLTLMDAGYSNVKDDLTTKQGGEGSGYTKVEEDHKNGNILPSAATASISDVIKSSMQNQPMVKRQGSVLRRIGTVCVAATRIEKAPLRRASSLDYADNCKQLHRVLTGLEKASSLDAAETALETTEAETRAPTIDSIDSLPGLSEALSRQSSGKSTCTDLPEPNDVSRETTEEAKPQVHQIIQKEVVKRSKLRNKETVNYFRESRSINRKVRSIEETETLLANARVKRELGTDFIGRRKTSKEIPPPNLPKDEVNPEPPVEPAPAEPAKVQRPRSIVDPLALWGAKPIIPKPQEQPKAVERLRAAVLGEGGTVKVGGTGENGLLARLRQRKTVH